MQESEFWLLISLKLSGEATPEELAELDEAMKQYPERASRADILNQIWEQKSNEAELLKYESFDRHIQRLSSHLADPAMQYESAEANEPPVKLRRINKWGMMIAAASVIALIGLYFLINTKEPANSEVNNVVSTKPGSKSRVQLPDGTQVWLNADSKITYTDFSKGVREVNLSGEAYFDVVKDKEHPFIIHAGAVDIKVLGTVFNVRSYADEKNTETSLIRGSVEVSIRCSPGKRIILKPNEKLIVKNDQPEALPSRASSPDMSKDTPMMILSRINRTANDSNAVEIQWVKNRLAFDAESLEEVARKIEHWYGVKVIISSENLRLNNYSGVFEDESLPQVMKALQLTGNFNYTIDKKLITIKP